jgi:hypothetical protein
MRWLILIVVVAIVIYAYFFQDREPQPEPNLVSPTASLVVPGPTTPALSPPIQRPQTTQQPVEDRRPLLEQAARQAGVTLVQYRPQPGGAVVSVSWSTSRADQGADFLEQARRNGAIRDFDVRSDIKVNMINDRRVYTATFTVMF